jgi:ER membrane protein SH3
VSAFVSAGAGFLLAVLWFDLMFDVQVLGRPAGELPETVLASIAAYYGRVTTAARPMNRLIATVMLATLAAIVVELVHADAETWVPWASLALALPPIALAAAHTVPSAVRLGARTDARERQSALARAICRDHLLCAAAISGLLVVQLAFA